ncbi:MAG TPA: disulfide oxidoreductase [Eubacteriaceae bacterium]|nr:disulfide oxidoreductase [Eubacteriaceae bacterium]
MKITKDMGIMDAVNDYPQTVDVFQRFGMHCFGCMAARFENIEEGAMAHGINVDMLIEELNDAVQ